MKENYPLLNKYISTDHFIESLKSPDWYIKLSSEQKKLQQTADGLPDPEKHDLAYEVYRLFVNQLACGQVALGSQIGNWDKERQSIDTIIIHHTSSKPGMSADLLSAIELIRLYAPYYLNPSDPKDKHIYGEAISSGHVRNGKQVFWPYHWLIRNDGSTERLLEDNETGWQAGNWGINCRSVAIVFDNDYTRTAPSDAELKSAADIVKNNYSGVNKKRIFGHREVNTETVCPSDLFLGQNGWKEKLLDFL